MRATGIHQFPQMDRVVFGKPAALAIAEEAERLNARRLFLLASNTLNTKTDEIEKVRKILGDRYAGTFDGVAQHTTRQQAVEVAANAIDLKADLIVAIGGGSLVDSAKIAQMCIEHNITDAAGLDGFENISTPIGPKPGPFRNPKVRMIAIPTTLSGGEFNAAALVTDTVRKLKQSFFHAQMMPRTIILDPAIVRYTPETLWLGSGTRALDHAIEAICSPGGNPLVDAACLEGIRTLTDGLLEYKSSPGDLAAMAVGQHGSWLSSFGLQARVPMGASHAIGHILGGTCNVPHYLCTAVMMPSVLRYNKPVTADKQAQIAEALGEPGKDAADAFSLLIDRLGLPKRLADVDVTESQFKLIGETAMGHMFTRTNPRPIGSAEDVMAILRSAA
jgi:maleylacetate reductase